MSSASSATTSTSTWRSLALPTREREAPLSAPLVAADGHVRFASGKVELCERLIGADPPDCVGSQLDVLGLDSSSVPQLVGSADVQWSEQPIQLSGVIEDGVLTVVTTPTQP